MQKTNDINRVGAERHGSASDEVRRIAARVNAMEDALRGMRDHYRQWSIPGTLYNQVNAALGEPNKQISTLK